MGGTSAALSVNDSEKPENRSFFKANKEHCWFAWGGGGGEAIQPLGHFRDGTAPSICGCRIFSSGCAGCHSAGPRRAGANWGDAGTGGGGWTASDLNQVGCPPALGTARPAGPRRGRCPPRWSGWAGAAAWREGTSGRRPSAAAGRALEHAAGDPPPPPPAGEKWKMKPPETPPALGPLQ